MDVSWLIKDVLGDFYHNDTLLLRSIKQESNNKFMAMYIFDTYQKTIDALSHVSMLQMHEALLEGLYCCIGKVIKDKVFPVQLNYETFLRKRDEAIYYRENLTFKKMLNPGDTACLKFLVKAVSEKKSIRDYYSIIVSVKGFVRGETECLLEKEGSR